jgi:hypothetical protein
MLNTRNFKLLFIDLTLFDGEGAAAGGDGGGNQAGSTGAQTVGQSATGDLSTLKFGKTDEGGGSAAGSKGTQTPTSDDIDAEFKALIGKDGKYKDAFERHFQSVFDRRFKGAKADQEKLEKYQPVMDSLAAKYGIEDADPDKLSAALEQDTAFWQEAAERAGFEDVQQYREFSRLQQENARFQAQQQAAAEQQQMLQKIQGWARDAKDLLDSGDYQFDPVAEIKNPQMFNLLDAGVPFRNAFEAVHIDEIKNVVAQKTAASTEKRVVDNVRAKGARPRENGAQSSSGVSFNPADPSTWTDAQFDEVLRRVKAGEEIKL